jgi:hypothetical protein
MNTNEILHIRQTLADNIDYLLETISSYKQEGQNNSMDLFGDELGPDVLELVPATRIDELNILLKEKEFLGLYVTKNPIIEFTPLLNYIRQVGESDNIYLILLDKIKKIFTKNKDMMFSLEVTIDGDKVDGIIFPKNAMALSPLLEEKTLYWVRGKVSTPKKRKQEIVVASDVEVEAEQGEPSQIQEFVELPKLIIENLVVFGDGPAVLFQGEQNIISGDRMKLIEAIDYKQSLNDPMRFTLSSVAPIIQTPQRIKLNLPNTLNSSQALEVKQLLSISGGLEYIIELHVQLPNGEYKVAKTEFPVSKPTYDKILSIISI